MISVINQPEVSRKKLSRLIVKNAIERSERKGRTLNKLYPIINRESMKRMFSEAPKSEEERKNVADFAQTVVMNFENRFTEQEKAFARMYLYLSMSGINTDMFFCGNSVVSRARSKLTKAASTAFAFNNEEDEELV